MQTIGKVNNTDESVTKAGLRRLNRVAEKSQLSVLLELFLTGIVICSYVAKSPAPGKPVRGTKVSPTFLEASALQGQEDKKSSYIPVVQKEGFSAPIFLTTYQDLSGVSQGKLVTINNFFELFDGILNPKQIEGLRLLLTPFPQQQFNQTSGRRNTGTAWTLRHCAS